MTWWKSIFDTKTPTWRAFGRVVFVEAETEAEAEPLALAAAQREFPGATIEPFALGASTPEAAVAFAERKARHAQWMQNTAAGVPNKRGDV